MKKILIFIIFSFIITNIYSQIVKIDSTIKDIVSLNTENSLFYGSTKFSIDDFIITDSNIVVLVHEKEAIYFLNKESKLIEDTINLRKKREIKFRSSYFSKTKSPIFSREGEMVLKSDNNVFVGIVATNKNAYQFNITQNNYAEFKSFNVDTVFKEYLKINPDTIYKDRNYRKFSSIMSALNNIIQFSNYNIYIFNHCPLLNYDVYINDRGMHPLEFGDFLENYPTILAGNKDANSISKILKSTLGTTVETYNDKLVLFDNIDRVIRVYSNDLNLLTEITFNNALKANYNKKDNAFINENWDNLQFYKLKLDRKQNRLYLVGNNRNKLTYIYQVNFDEEISINLVSKIESNFKYKIKQIYDNEFYFLIPNEGNLYIYKNSLKENNSKKINLNSLFYNEKTPYAETLESDITNVLINYDEDYLIPRKKDIKKYNIGCDNDCRAESVNELFEKTLKCIKNDEFNVFFSYLSAYTENDYEYYSSGEMNAYVPKNISEEVQYIENLQEMYKNKKYHKKDNYLLFFNDNMLSVVVEINKKWYLSVARLEYLIIRK